MPVSQLRYIIIRQEKIVANINYIQLHDKLVWICGGWWLHERSNKKSAYY
jgi:hypothetical protein